MKGTLSQRRSMGAEDRLGGILADCGFLGSLAEDISINFLECKGIHSTCINQVSFKERSWLSSFPAESCSSGHLSIYLSILARACVKLGNMEIPGSSACPRALVLCGAVQHRRTLYNICVGTSKQSNTSPSPQAQRRRRERERERQRERELY